MQKYGAKAGKPTVKIDTAFHPPPQQLLLTADGSQPEQNELSYLPSQLQQNAKRDLHNDMTEGSQYIDTNGECCCKGCCPNTGCYIGKEKPLLVFVNDSLLEQLNQVVGAASVPRCSPLACWLQIPETWLKMHELESLVSMLVNGLFCVWMHRMAEACLCACGWPACVFIDGCADWLDGC